MPAELPKTSAYTYCAELQIDGVDRVRFSKPVVTWVDNFLGFEVGTAVPVGYYDRDKGIWVAIPNGIVVTLLDINGDTAVDGILYLFRNVEFSCPDVENKVEAGISKFHEKDRGCRILEKILGIFYCIMGNLKKYLLDPSGI